MASETNLSCIIDEKQLSPNNWSNYFSGRRVCSPKSEAPYFHFEVSALRKRWGFAETALIYMNEDVCLYQEASRIHLTLRGSAELSAALNQRHTRIGFVVVQNSRRYVNKAFEWPEEKDKFCLRFSFDQTTKWLSRIEPSLDIEELSISLDGRKEPLYFGFYIWGLTEDELETVSLKEEMGFRVEVECVASALPSTHLAWPYYHDDTIAPERKAMIFGKNSRPIVPSELPDRWLLNLRDNVLKARPLLSNEMDVYKVLKGLAFRNGVAYPVAIKGDIVQKALRRDLSDARTIHMEVVVGGPIEEMCECLWQITQSGHSQNLEVFIVKDIAGDSIGLRMRDWCFVNATITPLKALKRQPVADSCSSSPDSTFEWSYLEDAKDYSMNDNNSCIYLQLFPKPVLIDPLGLNPFYFGKKNAEGEEHTPQCSYAKAEAFDSDLGKQFCVWKTFVSNEPEEEREELGTIFDHVDGLIFDHVGCLLDNIQNVLQESDTEKKEKLGEELGFYFSTLHSKLFDDDQKDVHDQVSSMHEHLKEWKWWQQTIELASSFLETLELFDQSHKLSDVRELVKLIAEKADSEGEEGNWMTYEQSQEVTIKFFKDTLPQLGLQKQVVEERFENHQYLTAHSHNVTDIAKDIFRQRYKVLVEAKEIKIEKVEDFSQYLAQLGIEEDEAEKCTKRWQDAELDLDVLNHEEIPDLASGIIQRNWEQWIDKEIEKNREARLEVEQNDSEGRGSARTTRGHSRIASSKGRGAKPPSNQKPHNHEKTEEEDAKTSEDQASQRAEKGSNDFVILKHGTTLASAKSIGSGRIRLRGENSDFASGYAFYMGDDTKYAQIRAIEKSSSGIPVVINFKIPTSVLEREKNRHFPTNNKDWQDFVLRHRRAKGDAPPEHPIISGPILANVAFAKREIEDCKPLRRNSKKNRGALAFQWALLDYEVAGEFDRHLFSINIAPDDYDSRPEDTKFKNWANMSWITFLREHVRLTADQISQKKLVWPETN